jgi:glycosyltransferase involved in cell wall biosynthesis
LPNPQNIILRYGPSRNKREISFFPALMSSEEINLAKKISTPNKWKRDKFIFLLVGRLSPVKGFDLVINGLGLLADLKPEFEFELKVIGDGPQKDDLIKLSIENKIDTSVDFLGSMSFDNVQKQYANANFLLMPGVKEGWPKTIPEAWAHLCIPIGSASGLVPTIIDDNKTGFLFKPTPIDFANRLITIINIDREKLLEVANSSYDKVLEMSLEKFGSNLQTILENFLRK